jgi:hypothetical protein
MPLINSEDKRLTARERHLLRQIATRLEAKPYVRPIAASMPEGYQRELERVFGSDCEPETNRWER